MGNALTGRKYKLILIVATPLRGVHGAIWILPRSLDGCRPQRGTHRASSRPSARSDDATIQAARRSMKRRLLELNLLKNECSRCDIAQWRGKPLIIHIDHINGINNDWRLDDLRMLCPNCHSQTPTFSGRNVRRVH